MLGKFLENTKFIFSAPLPCSKTFPRHWGYT